MTDNQGKNLRPEQVKQRERINNIIEEAYNGRDITEVLKEVIPTKTGTYYKNVIKIPLPGKFIKWIKNELNIDISIINDSQTDSESLEDPKGYETLRLKWDAARDENVSLLKDKIAQADKIKGLEAKVAELEDQVKKLRKILADNNIAI